MDTNQFKFLMYRSVDGDVSVNAIIKDETIWLTQKALAELFGVDKSSISRHLKNIFVEGELDEKVVVAEIATTTQHGAIQGKTQSRETKFYNLDAIISVGYRVNSRRATQIRRLESAVSGYFDYIEDLIEREITFTMEEFAASVNEFLAFRRYDILQGSGHISRKTAEAKAIAEYEEFNKTQRLESDFDKEVKKMIGIKKD